MPRYVILEHDHPYLHWDFMLEMGEKLRTWRLSQPPQTNQRVEAICLFDHRRLYLDYEGPVSGNRGTVTRWDWGTFEMLEHTESLILIVLNGERCRGLARLERVEEVDWTFCLTD